ncbi:uncharacterized protein LOC128391866 [Panonychus citri]|uniref:uncharacterized protein LOC128391866 n=1 Tax=Panonychus citri TaxID=50023 RepID=UPI00230776C2|nr:uncharacterized protein LOC128391866 [Panonychus citri]
MINSGDNEGASSLISGHIDGDEQTSSMERDCDSLNHDGDGTQSVRVAADMDEFPVKSLPYCALRGGKIFYLAIWEHSIIPGDRIINPKDLEGAKMLPWDQLVRLAGGEDKLIEVQEKEAVVNKQEHCFLYECAYCGISWPKLTQLIYHVIGRKRDKNQRYLKITCEERVVVDGLESTSRVPPSAAPTVFPWGKVVCTNPDLFIEITDPTTGEVTGHDFELPEDQQTAWDKVMVDRRVTQAGS